MGCLCRRTIRQPWPKRSCGCFARRHCVNSWAPPRARASSRNSAVALSAPESPMRTSSLLLECAGEEIVVMSLKIVVLGMMGCCPVGGQAWIYLNWLRAFSKLGHDVYYVEDDPSWPYDPTTNCITDDCTYAVRHVSGCLTRCGFEGKWAYRLPDRKDRCWGMKSAEIDELYRSCDIL